MASRQISVLPVESRSIIRSTTIVTSLPQIVFELVQNSLDAGALHVDVGIDAEDWQCWVRDNGNGIDRSGLTLLAKGSEDGRYGTSKAYDSASLADVSTFGFRGEALASAADLSCLEISSRTSASRETWSVILKGGKTLYCGTAVRWRREKPGTTVCIRDAFYNLPIRRLSHPNPARTLELIRKDMESIALVFPHVVFSLENSAKEKQEGGGKGRVMTIPKTPCTLSAFRHLFGKALCEHVDEVNVCKDDMRIQGFLSLEGAHSKAHQHLYVNRHPLSPCDLHRVIDARFAVSSFGRHALDEARSPRPVSRRSPRKNERRPAYVLNITVPPRSIDNCFEPAKAVVHFEHPDAVSSFVSSLVQSFLVRHGFSNNLPANARTTDDSPYPRKRRKLIPEGTISGVTDDEQIQRPRPAPRPGAASGSRKHEHDVALIAEPFTDFSREMAWVDPSTGQAYMVDPRTGNSYRMNSRKEERDDYSSVDSRIRGRTTERTLVDMSWLRKRRDGRCEEEEEVPQWIQEALDGWQNPTFGLDEPSVPALTSFLSLSRQPWLSEPGQPSSSRGRVFDPNLAAGRKHNATDASRTFDKKHLKRAEIVGQVDKKFVAALLDDAAGGGSKTLVLVDQHAADERIRVERFLSELCQGFLDHGGSGRVEMRELRPAVPVLLTRLEVRELARSEVYRLAFEKWGFRFTPLLDEVAGEEDEGGDEYVQIMVEAIPDVVGEKLLLADELRELIKGFLARLGAEGAAYNASASDKIISGPSWITALRWCPRELLDLVNSKACRGAIMFNDTLDVEQCQRLMGQLSETVWPFMCAHGRPSLVPLTNIELAVSKRRGVDWSNFAVDQ